MCVHGFVARLSVTDEAQYTKAYVTYMVYVKGAGIETMTLRFLALPAD
jgi:hypothetical protein